MTIGFSLSAANAMAIGFELVHHIASMGGCSGALVARVSLVANRRTRCNIGAPVATSAHPLQHRRTRCNIDILVATSVTRRNTVTLAVRSMQPLQDRCTRCKTVALVATLLHSLQHRCTHCNIGALVAIVRHPSSRSLPHSGATIALEFVIASPIIPCSSASNEYLKSQRGHQARIA
jgi:hypothetical protein